MVKKPVTYKEPIIIGGFRHWSYVERRMDVARHHPYCGGLFASHSRAYYLNAKRPEPKNKMDYEELEGKIEDSEKSIKKLKSNVWWLEVFMTIIVVGIIIHGF